MRPTIRTTHCALVAAAVIGLTAPLAAQAMTTTRAEPRPTTVREAHLERMTILDIQRAMDRERLTSEQLTDLYLKRIRALNPRLRAVVTVNPDAKGIARDSDRRRRTDGARGPLEGIPVLLKENMNTADRQPTTAEPGRRGGEAAARGRSRDPRQGEHDGVGQLP